MINIETLEENENLESISSSSTEMSVTSENLNLNRDEYINENEVDDERFFLDSKDEVQINFNDGDEDDVSIVWILTSLIFIFTYSKNISLLLISSML